MTTISEPTTTKGKLQAEHERATAAFKAAKEKSAAIRRELKVEAVRSKIMRAETKLAALEQKEVALKSALAAVQEDAKVLNKQLDDLEAQHNALAKAK